MRVDLRRNFLSFLAHGPLGQTGFRLVSMPTFMPNYLLALSGSEIWVGIARGAQALGQALSPILGASLIEHRPRALRIGLSLGAAMRVQLLGIAAAGFWLGAPWNLYATIACLGLFGFFQGMSGVAFNHVRAKVIPTELRGRLAGLRTALGGLLTSVVAGFSGALVARDALGNGYATVLALGFVFTAFGLVAISFTREPPAPDMRAREPLPQRLAALPGLLRSDRDYAAYLAARALATLGRMAVPYYVLFGAERLGSLAAALGALSIAFTLANSVGNLFWGALADRRGFRAVFAAGLVAWIAATLVLLSASSFGAFVLVLAALGLGLGGVQMAQQNLVLEFGRRADQPMRIALAQSTELMGAVGPVLGGALIATSSYPTMFWLAIACKGAALVLIWTRVREPRFSPSAPGS